MYEKLEIKDAGEPCIYIFFPNQHYLIHLKFQLRRYHTLRIIRYGNRPSCIQQFHGFDMQQVFCENKQLYGGITLLSGNPIQTFKRTQGKGYLFLHFRL